MNRNPEDLGVFDVISLFLVLLPFHSRTGRDWAKLSEAVGTKSISQIKNFYYDFKKQLSSGKFRQGMEKGNFKSGPGTVASSSEPSPAPKAKEEPLKSPRQKLLKKKKKGGGGGPPPSVPKLGSKSMVKKTAIQSQLAAKRSKSTTPTEPTEPAIPIQHDVLMQQEEMAARNEAQLHYQNQMSANPPMHSNDLERILAGNPSYGGPNYPSQSELIQHLLQQQHGLAFVVGGQFLAIDRILAGAYGDPLDLRQAGHGTLQILLEVLDALFGHFDGIFNFIYDIVRFGLTYFENP